MSTANLGLTLKFPRLARRPDVRRWLRRWDVCVQVDDQLHVFHEGPQHRLSVSAGPRTIHVWFRGAGLAFLVRGFQFGKRSVLIDMPANGTVELVYEGSTFWHAGGSAELRVV